MAAGQASTAGLPASLVERVIRRESGGNPRAVHAGNYGLMQIRLSTARAMGYTGSAAGLLDPQTNMTYALRYLAVVDKVRTAEAKVASASRELSKAVAKNLFKLMAYKDEYEVARLYTNGSFAKKLSEKFDGDFRLKFYLAPPIFAKRDKSGRLQKREYGGWIIHAFRLLARLKSLRGTPYDPFGRTADAVANKEAIGIAPPRM